MFKKLSYLSKKLVNICPKWSILAQEWSISVKNDQFWSKSGEEIVNFCDKEVNCDDNCRKMITLGENGSIFVDKRGTLVKKCSVLVKIW